MDPATETRSAQRKWLPIGDRYSRHGDSKDGNRLQVQTTQTPPSESKFGWPPTTVAWTAITALVPLNYALPPAAKALWFVAIGAMIGIPVLFLWVARPLYPAVWIFAGYASLASVLLATNESTISDNIFIGTQLMLILGFGVFRLTYDALVDPRLGKRLGLAFLAGQSLSAIAAFLQLLGYPILMSQSRWWNHRVQGLADHPNTLGIMSATAIVIALQFAFISRKYRLFAIAAVAVNTLSLVGSGSLTGVLALSIGLIVSVLCMRDHLGKIAIRGTVSAVAIWLALSAAGVVKDLPSLSQRYSQVTGQTSGGSSLEDRGQTYEFAWNKISDDPIFGSGLSGRTSGTYNGITMVHNAFLRAWYQGGIFLAIAFALIIGAIVFVLFRALVRKQDIGEAAVIAVILVYGSVSPLLEQRQFWLPFLVAWSSISAKAVIQERANQCANHENSGGLTQTGNPS